MPPAGFSGGGLFLWRKHRHFLQKSKKCLQSHAECSKINTQRKLFADKSARCMKKEKAMAFSALPRNERRKAGCADVTGFADDIK